MYVCAYVYVRVCCLTFVGMMMVRACVCVCVHVTCVHVCVCVCVCVLVVDLVLTWISWPATVFLACVRACVCVRATHRKDDWSVERNTKISSVVAG